MSREIHKKIWPEFFEKVLSGEKRFELRVADLEISTGDTLVLEEWNPKTKMYTGRSLTKTADYILKSSLLMFTHLLSAFAPSALSWEHENTSSSQPRPLPKGDGSAQIASSALFQETVV